MNNPRVALPAALANAIYHKSSRSSAAGSCVEVAAPPVALTFTAGIRADEFD